MGLKIRLGLAGMGLFMSYFFGLHGLTGIASHLDSTGNILVDIADGIGLVSKGIEALETWVDPTSNEQPTVEQPEENSAGIATNPSPPPPPSIENQKTSETPTTAPKPVICKKGKCQPYDPAKDRVLQQQLIKAERERILQQIQSGAWPADTAVPVAQLLDEDGEEIDDDELPKIRKLRAAQKQIKASSSHQKSTISSGGTTSTTVSSTPPSIQILDPSSPNLDDLNQQEQENNAINSGGWRFGAKRILGSFAGVCQRLNQLLLKVVAKVFPWNRRAKRRLKVGGADADEE